MPERIKQGEKLPFFRYDTPYSTQNRSRALLAEHPPLVLVFMSNFGHPITRAFAERYAETYPALTAGSLAMVVRSRPEKLAASIGPQTLPFPLLCDAEGTLYEYLQIPQRSGALMTYSLEAWGILRQARRQGYRPPKDALQQLPLTLILGADGTVLFCHYGASLTDVPQDCAAIQQLLAALGLAPGDAGAPAPEIAPLEVLPDDGEDELDLTGEFELTGDLLPETPADPQQALLQDPEDTFSQGLPLDLAPETPAPFRADTGPIAPLADDLPQPPAAPAEEAPAAPRRRHRPVGRRAAPPAETSEAPVAPAPAEAAPAETAADTRLADTGELENHPVLGLFAPPEGR